jgi:hypothetical protein
MTARAGPPVHRFVPIREEPRPSLIQLRVETRDGLYPTVTLTGPRFQPGRAGARVTQTESGSMSESISHPSLGGPDNTQREGPFRRALLYICLKLSEALAP